jgi:hypothetical protein
MPLFEIINRGPNVRNSKHKYMKKTIFDALKTKYANKGFGDKAFDGVASYLEKTVTEESQVEAAVADVEALLTAFQGDVDRLRTENAQLNAQLKAQAEQKPKEDERKPEEDTGEPTWFKKYREETDKKLGEITKEKETNTRKARLDAALKDVPPHMRDTESMIAFSSDDEVEAYITKKLETAKTYAESLPRGYGKPFISGGKPNEVNPALQERAKRRAEVRKSTAVEPIMGTKTN